MQQWDKMSDTLTEGDCVGSSDTKGHVLQDVTEDDVPSVEVTLSFDNEDEEEDSNMDVTQRQSVIKKSFRCSVCGLNFDTLFKLKRHRICSEGCIKENTITAVSVKSEPVIYTDLCDRRKEKQTEVNPEPGHNTSICSEDESRHPDSLQQSRSSDTSGRQMCKRSSRIKTCSKCGQAFTSSADLTSHTRTHTEGDSHICGECGKDFDNYEKLKLHQENGCRERNNKLMDVKYIQEMQQMNIKKCAVLLRRLSPSRVGDFLSKNAIQTENPVTDSDVIKPCNLNSLTSATQNNTETDSDSQIIQSECENSTSTKLSTMKCTLCDKTFSELDLMQRHYYKSHMVNGSFQCTACKRAFVRICDIVRHHQKMRLYPCATCKRCFSKPSGLKRHKTTFNDACKIPRISEKKIRKSCYIARRLEAHKNTQPNVCSYCDKTFSTADTLRVHMFKHSGGFSCPICAKVFNRKIYLNRHIDRHNGQEPYLCEICGQGWSTQRYLDIHMIKHTDERPFKCDQCDKTFKRVNVLRVHIRSKHLDLRPYVCRVCGKAHRFSQDLKRHMIKHTGVYPHNCSRCGKGFGRLYYLKKHQETKCK